MKEGELKNRRIIVKSVEDDTVLADTAILRFNSDSNSVMIRADSLSCKERVVSLLRRVHFSYPVCIDEKDSFNLLNKFPKDNRFQTFLLDKNKKVVAIGNPINNP